MNVIEKIKNTLFSSGILYFKNLLHIIYIIITYTATL